MTDPISDMIIRIKNAGISHKETVTFPYSNLKFEICSILEKQGFIKSHAKKGKKVAKSIEVGLLYDGPHSHIQGVKRVSKPSRRIYKKVSDIRPIRNGYGNIIISTPKGLKTDVEARKEKLGGEVLFQIW